MATSNTTDSLNLDIKKNEYVAFDAVSLRDFIRQRLTDSGLFTDNTSKVLTLLLLIILLLILFIL